MRSEQGWHGNPPQCPKAGSLLLHCFLTHYRLAGGTRQAVFTQNAHTGNTLMLAQFHVASLVLFEAPKKKHKTKRKEKNLLCSVISYPATKFPSKPPLTPEIFPGVVKKLKVGVVLFIYNTNE